MIVEGKASNLKPNDHCGNLFTKKRNRKKLCDNHQQLAQWLS
jgi:hypothetical protein